jgi:hypothetical protein
MCSFAHRDDMASMFTALLVVDRHRQQWRAGGERRGPAKAAVQKKKGSWYAQSTRVGALSPCRLTMPVEVKSCDWLSVASVKTATEADRKQRHVTLWLQKDAASSSANSTPPMGAPNAAASPLAAPAEMNSRWSRHVRFRRYRF